MGLHLDDELQSLGEQLGGYIDILLTKDERKDLLIAAMLKDHIKPVDFFEDAQMSPLYDESLTDAQKVESLKNNLYAILESELFEEIYNYNEGRSENQQERSDYWNA